MNVITKFSLGDTVYSIRRDFVNRVVKCKACQNTGSVQIDGEAFECPKCKGKSKHPESAGIKSIVWESGVVGQVRCTVTDGAYHEERRNYDLSLGEHPPVIEIQYMLDCTGIGSGTLWGEKDLFLTREEAQDYCDSRNINLLRDEA